MVNGGTGGLPENLARTEEWERDKRRSTDNLEFRYGIASNGEKLGFYRELHRGTLERLCGWCIRHSVSTGHADSLPELLDEMLPQLDTELEDLLERRKSDKRFKVSHPEPLQGPLRTK